MPIFPNGMVVIIALANSGQQKPAHTQGSGKAGSVGGAHALLLLLLLGAPIPCTLTVCQGSVGAKQQLGLRA
jgi:hypothetical protein